MQLINENSSSCHFPFFLPLPSMDASIAQALDKYDNSWYVSI